MSKDYKATPTKTPATKTPPTNGQKPANKGSPLMMGLLIGLLVGIALSLVVAFSVQNGGSSFQDKAKPAPGLPADPKPAPQEAPPAAAIAPETGQISSETMEPNKNPTEADKKEDRFTFYGILTENNPPAPVAETKEPKEPKEQKEPTQPNPPTAIAAPAVPDSPATPSTPKPTSERYYLQVGAFQTEKEADNTKAKLSLIGLDAVVQTATIPNKGILHRVRVGPITGSEELKRVKTELSRNGFSAEPVKISN